MLFYPMAMEPLHIGLKVMELIMNITTKFYLTVLQQVLEQVQRQILGMK